MFRCSSPHSLGFRNSLGASQNCGEGPNPHLSLTPLRGSSVRGGGSAKPAVGVRKLASDEDVLDTCGTVRRQVLSKNVKVKHTDCGVRLP